MVQPARERRAPSGRRSMVRRRRTLAAAIVALGLLAIVLFLELGSDPSPPQPFATKQWRAVVHHHHCPPEPALCGVR